MLSFVAVLAIALPLCASIPSGVRDDLAAQIQNACPVGLTERYTAPAAGNTPTNTFWSYNAARQPVTLTKPDGTVISNAYDVAGRLIAVTAARDGASDSVAFEYDDAGRLGSVSRDGSALQYGYDCFLRTDETTPNGTLAWEYDDDFRVIGLSLDGIPCASYTYDDDGALSQAGDLSLLTRTTGRSSMRGQRVVVPHSTFKIASGCRIC